MDTEDRQNKLLLGMNSLKTGAKLLSKCVNLYNSFRYLDGEENSDSDFEAYSDSDSDFEVDYSDKEHRLERVYKKEANALNSAAKLKMKEVETLRKIAQSEENEKQKIDDKISLLEKKKFQAIECEDYRRASKFKRKILKIFSFKFR